MNESDQFEKIGQVLKSNGASGELVIGLRGIAAEDINFQEPVFIFWDGMPVPNFMYGVSARGASRILAHLTDVSTKEDAEQLVGRAVYLPAEDFESDEDGFIGWTLEGVGEVVDIEDIPGNPCLVVERGGEEVLVPFHEDLVVSVDEKSRTIAMRLPEGLLS